VDDHPLEVEVVRSSGRVKTASARWTEPGKKVLVRVPAGLPAPDEQRLVDQLVAKMRAGARRRRLNDLSKLPQRAGELNKQYFGGRLKIASIEWVTNQRGRYGSCTPELQTIRISDRVATMPGWVQDYVLMHELSHLLEPNHSAAFWKLVSRYPLTERARGYLIALGMESMDGPGDDRD